MWESAKTGISRLFEHPEVWAAAGPFLSAWALRLLPLLTAMFGWDPIHQTHFQTAVDSLGSTLEMFGKCLIAAIATKNSARNLFVTTPPPEGPAIPVAPAPVVVAPPHKTPKDF